MNKIKIINLPEITAADNTTYIPVSTGVTNATRKISAANLSGFDNVSYLPQTKTGMEMAQARDNIGAVKRSYAEVEDNLLITYSADPIDPNGDEVFKIENSNTPGEPDLTMNDFGYMYLRKGIYMAAGADIEGVTAADFFNLKDITSPVQAQLNSKAPLHSPTFIGVPLFSGDGAQFNCPVVLDNNVSVTGVLFGENEIGANKVLANETIQFGPDAVVKIQTGVSGGLPVYREFPATELSSSDLNGSNYVMVYGVGTPTENAAELQNAYVEAAKMPRFIGNVSYGDPYKQYYRGQSFYQLETDKYRRLIQDVASVGNGDVSNPVYSDEITESEAKAVSTSIVIAPGEYKFATYFDVSESGINISSLTGLMDVKISSMIVSGGYSTIYGVDCMEGLIDVATNYENVSFIKCRGGYASFGGSDTTSSNDVSSTFIDCIGGDYSFGGYSIASGRFVRCTGGNYSFGGSNTASGVFIDCTGGTSSFGGEGVSTGKFTRCSGDSLSFGGDSYGDSECYYCRGGALSFGYGSDANGVYRNCTGGEDSFGGGMGSSIAGKFFYCEVTGSTTGMNGSRAYCIVNNAPISS